MSIRRIDQSAQVCRSLGLDADPGFRPERTRRNGIVHAQDPVVVGLAVDDDLNPAEDHAGSGSFHPIRLARQLACAARRNHPGEGDSPRPPMDFGMSVVSFESSGPVTVTRSLSSRTAVAALSVYLASLR